MLLPFHQPQKEGTAKNARDSADGQLRLSQNGSSKGIGKHQKGCTQEKRTRQNESNILTK